MSSAQGDPRTIKHHHESIPILKHSSHIRNRIPKSSTSLSVLYIYARLMGSGMNTVSYYVNAILRTPKGGRLNPCRNLRPVNWFHFSVSSISSSSTYSVALSVLSLLMTFFFCTALVKQLGEVSWSVVCAACCHMAPFCHMAPMLLRMNLYNILFVCLFCFYPFFFKSGNHKLDGRVDDTSSPSRMCFL